MKRVLLTAVTLIGLVGCSDTSDSGSRGSALESNTSWPLEVMGTVDIVDAGVGESDYANWAIGSITVNGEDVSIEIDQSVLKAGRINLDFEFDEPETLLLGKPNEKYGVLIYPIKEIR